MPKVPGHRQDLGVVGAALDDHVDLDGIEADLLRHLDALEHIGHRKIDIVHAPEGGVVQAIQAHGHALQASVFKGLRFFSQQRGVGGQRYVQRLSGRRLQLSQHFNQHFKVFTQ